MSTFDSLLQTVLQKDSRYASEAYLFAQECLDHAIELRERRDQRRPRSKPAEAAAEHIAAQELCEAFRDLAVERFGMLASDVLASWGMRRTRDLGNVIFNLVEAGAMRANADDHVEDFDDCFDFERSFLSELDLI